MRTLDLRRGFDGRLFLLRQAPDGSSTEVPVQVALCFPWTRPDAFLSLRNGDGGEERFLENYRDLPAAARELLEEEIRKRYFVARIVRVDEVRDEAELFRWKVLTDAGPRTFLASRTDRPRQLPGGGIVLRDVSGDAYVIPDPNDLDPASRKRCLATL
ncbi:MAG: DUF1854 domain-containing protein [Planctomycetota bacterium]